MPQDNLFNDTETYTGLRITLEEVSTPEGPEWNLEVRRLHRNEGWQTVSVSRWKGLMLDLIGTMYEDLIHAFLYDERRGLAKAHATVLRLARRHAITYGRR